MWKPFSTSRTRSSVNEDEAMEPMLSTPSRGRTVLDHAANEPQTATRTDSAYQHELERVTRTRTYFDDHDPVNAAIRRHPTRAMFIAAGVGFVAALLMR